jgi:hypothetical protein
LLEQVGRRTDEFQRHLAGELRILREKYLAHPALAKLTHYAVIGEPWRQP